MEDKELFKAPRWNEYQPVKVTNITVKPTKEDEEKVKEFRKFIDEKNANKVQDEEK